MDTITISKVIAGEGRKPWKIYDGNGAEYVTWDGGIGAAADALFEKQAQIEYEVQEKAGERGVFKNKILQKVEPVPEAAAATPANAPDYEPSVNTGKQVVIIRQSAWNQTNQIYGHAVELYKMVMTEVPFDVSAVHAIAWQLYSSSKRPEHSNMHTIAHDIEVTVRADWFPLTSGEIPFAPTAYNEDF